MKALILSAGPGTRLQPLIRNMPKVMVPIAKKPLLWYHIQLLKKHGIKDIWINLHWYPHSIKNYFGDGSKFGVKISYSYEKELLGTAGALKNPASGIENEFKKSAFLVVYGDNLTNFDHTRLIQFHKRRRAFATIGLYKSPDPWTMGVVEINEQGKILKFVEKPPKEAVTTNTVSAGILVCEPELLDYIPDGASDFAFDIFPKLLKLRKPLFALNTGSYVQDCGTPGRLAKARRDFTTGKFDSTFY
ncbi:MAG: nucleotidyltransferase family protein [bacterium]|nr:nucleotidyltransferase family protein [bacterium]